MMQFTNSDDRYGLIAKFFHWTIAFIILGLLPVGLGMGMMENSPLKFEVYAMHKSFGLLVFFLGLARLLWRFITPAPDHLETHKPWERSLASAAHVWLYICMIGMPLSGWLMSSAGEFPVPFFGYQMPHLLTKDENLAELFGQIHQILGYTLLGVLGLHMAGALKHQIIDRDETLSRMTWQKAGLFVTLVIILEAGASYALSAMAIYKDLTTIRTEQPAEEKVEAPAERAPIDVAALLENEWAIVQDKSKVNFTASLYNSDFTTEIRDITGEIFFNPDNLAQSRASVRVGTKGLSSGDAERDGNMKSADWLDSEKYPDIWFVSDQFEKADGDNYVAIGTLSVKGKTMPLILPFTLELDDKTAHMTAKVSVNRLDFGVGEGPMSDADTVGHTIAIQIDLTAIR